MPEPPPGAKPMHRRTCFHSAIVGASPEEFEAYRIALEFQGDIYCQRFTLGQQCWRQYFQWWQPYRGENAKNGCNAQVQSMAEVLRPEQRTLSESFAAPRVSDSGAAGLHEEPKARDLEPWH